MIRSNLLSWIVLLCAASTASHVLAQGSSAAAAFDKGNLSEARRGFTADSARGDAGAKIYLAYLDARQGLRAGRPAPGPFGLLKQQADGGDALAQALLGQLYLAGYGGRFLGDDDGSTLRAAVDLLDRASAAGNAVAQNNLGFLYLRGVAVAGQTLVSPDRAQAIKWLRVAASQGSLTAAVNLGEILASGPEDARDYGNALMWFNKAAAHHDARAETWLARMYEEGHGVARDEKAAQAWDARATEDDPDKEGTMYDHAFHSLRLADYQRAAGEFTQFLQRYPDSEHAPDASYWLGEIGYVSMNYRDASNAFRAVAERYPHSDKAPDALLKLARCERALGKKAQADAAIAALLKNYPASPAASRVRGPLAR